MRVLGVREEGLHIILVDGFNFLGICLGRDISHTEGRSLEEEHIEEFTDSEHLCLVRI